MAAVRILVGGGTGYLQQEALSRGWGRLWGVRLTRIHVAPGEWWGLDNGAFGDWRAGRPFDERRFRVMVERAVELGGPGMAVVPDVVGDWTATLRKAEDELHKLPAFPWYLVLQDGARPHDIEPFKDEIAGLFLGGTDRFKKHAHLWRKVATSLGLRFHYGRASTENRIRDARRVNADSLDSNQGLWSIKKWRKFVSYVDGHQTEMSIHGR